MARAALHLVILSPERELVSSDVALVSLPGAMAPFTVLPGHAPIISSLEKGEVRYVTDGKDGKEERIAVRSGFVEVRDNQVRVCVEIP